MKILLVAATLPETELLRSEWGRFQLPVGQVDSYSWEGLELCLLHTGIGMVNTAYQLGRFFLQNQVDLAIQFGIAGSFTESAPLGSVVEVTEEIYADLVAESPEELLDLEQMGFENFRANQQLYRNKISNPGGQQTSFSAERGITVNRVHGREATIKEILARWQPGVESMEGAAFFQACLMNEVPFLELRGISNWVTPRDRSAWQIGPAVSAVQKATLEYLKKLASRG